MQKALFTCVVYTNEYYEVALHNCCGFVDGTVWLNFLPGSCCPKANQVNLRLANKILDVFMFSKKHKAKAFHSALNIEMRAFWNISHLILGINWQERVNLFGKLLKLIVFDIVLMKLNFVMVWNIQSICTVHTFLHCYVTSMLLCLGVWQQFAVHGMYFALHHTGIHQMIETR